MPLLSFGISFFIWFAFTFITFIFGFWPRWCQCAFYSLIELDFGVQSSILEDFYLSPDLETNLPIEKKSTNPASLSHFHWIVLFYFILVFIFFCFLIVVFSLANYLIYNWRSHHNKPVLFDTKYVTLFIVEISDLRHHLKYYHIIMSVDCYPKVKNN